MKKIAILQSSYIPWKGYFDMINMADEFILYDCCQYTKHDWRNRNRIKTANTLAWLTIPIRLKGEFGKKISEATVADTRWARKHWQTLLTYYAKAEYFSKYKKIFESLYLDSNEEYLSLINRRFLTAICDLLGIQTRISWATDFHLMTGKTECLVHLCEQAGATEYLSGPAAKAYLDEELFKQANISVRYMDYSGYPEYHQFGSQFEHGVSIVDLLFHMGPKVQRYMKSFALPI